MPKKEEAERFALLHVQGGVEAALVGEDSIGWDDFEKAIQKYIREADYDPYEDGLFFVEMDKDGKLIDICSFTAGFMNDMRAKAKS